MNLRGQGALEYLLMIGAGIAIAAVVLYFVLASGGSATCESYKSQVAGLCAAKSTQDICDRTGDIDPHMSLGGNDNECEWDAMKEKCVIRQNLPWDSTDYC